MAFFTRQRLLTIVMALMGLLLIAGSALSSFGNILFPVDVLVGTHASVAGMAFGAGICLAAWNPSQNISWVRISILYAVLVLVYDVIAGFAFGAPFQVRDRVDLRRPSHLLVPAPRRPGPPRGEHADAHRVRAGSARLAD